MFDFSQKINLVFFGACTPLEIITSDPYYSKKYNILHTFLGSLSRMDKPPGKIAKQLEEEIHDKKLKTDPRQDNHIIKKIHPTDYLKNLPPNTVVIIDHSYEMQNFYYDGDDLFDVVPYYDTIFRYYPSWLRKKIAQNMKYYDSGIKELAIFQHRSIRNFGQSLFEAKVPAIITGNYVTTKIYDKFTNTVGDILETTGTQINLYNKKFPLEKFINSDSFTRFKYCLEVVDHFYDVLYNESFNRHPYVQIFNIPKDQVYCDPESPMGFHPTHLHRKCWGMLRPNLEATIIEAALAYDDYIDNKSRLTSVNDKILI